MDAAARISAHGASWVSFLSHLLFFPQSQSISLFLFTKSASAWCSTFLFKPRQTSLKSMQRWRTQVCTKNWRWFEWFVNHNLKNKLLRMIWTERRFQSLLNQGGWYCGTVISVSLEPMWAEEARSQILSLFSIPSLKHNDNYKHNYEIWISWFPFALICQFKPLGLKKWHRFCPVNFKRKPHKSCSIFPKTDSILQNCTFPYISYPNLPIFSQLWMLDKEQLIITKVVGDESEIQFSFNKYHLRNWNCPFASY